MRFRRVNSKKSTKKIKTKKSIFDASELNLLTLEKIEKTNSKDSLSPLKSESWYKIHAEELEKHADELIKRNKELEEKEQRCIELEKENFKLTMESIKYKRIKKIAGEFMNKSFENEIKQFKHKCNNPICYSTLVTLMDLQKEFDKLLIENIKLKKQNYSLKHKL